MSHEMAAFFDKLAPDWGNDPDGYELRETLTSMMGLAPGGVIADVGCGKGVMFPHLLNTGPAKLVAVDVSGEMLRLAGELFSDARIEYVNGDFLDAPLPPLDAAVIFNAYPHFTDKAALAAKLAQAVKPNGTAVIAHSMGREALNAHHTGQRVSKLSVPLEQAEVEAGRFAEFFSADALIDNDEMFFIKLSRK